MADQRSALGKKILAARLEKRWKQKQLAAAVSVEPDTVSRWENGRHAPDLDMLALIARETGKPLSFFVDEPPINGDDPFARLQAEVAEVRRSQERQEKMLEEILATRGRRAAPSSG